MRRRYISESENFIAQVIVEGEQEKEGYKDKPGTTTNNQFGFFRTVTNNISANFSTKSEPQSSGSKIQLAPLSPNTDYIVMTARDRTSEFANTIRSLQSRNINRAINLRDPKKVKKLQSYSEFTMIAKTIGKNIANTYSKLEKLTLCEFGTLNSHFNIYLVHIKLI